MERKQITVRGVVQGVGFRPFVYNLAIRHGLTGWVLNHSGGVDMEVEGPAPAVAAFLHDLTAQAPPLARIEDVAVQDADPVGYTGFEIRHSQAQEGRYQLISPDMATCADCRRELLDPADRRYRYPFTNCTNCGPRFTIIADIPYDRPNTTMRVFPMCPDCQAEYDDPTNRRFHAQPNACPVCGPHVWLVLSPESQVSSFEPQGVGSDPIAATAQLLRQGAVIAIKGLGGFHLACDAASTEAVRTLRARKGRPTKPLAVMMATLDDVRRHCDVTPAEEELLTSHQCPIVLLRWREDSAVVREVAPGNRFLGVMLPYTPLHHVLLRDAGVPLVMTSGNLSEEPIAKDNDEALRRLGHLADYFLLHDRDIYARYDDSVWFVPTVEGESYPQPIRRSRGYAPFPVKLPYQSRPILATGAELKNSFCLARDEYAFLSQHIGDMENLETLEHFEASIALYKHLFRVEPELIAHDLHPDYLATRYAITQCTTKNMHPASCIVVQHHHAHLAACLADNDWDPDAGPAIGVSLDGTGYGLDGHIWGGEWLVGDYRGFRRAGHLEYLPLPGGDAATRNPYRIAVAYLYTLLGEWPDPARFPFLTDVTPAELDVLRQQLDRRVNVPLTSSAGRLFDAVSALANVCTRATYEAQAAIELEMESGDGADKAGEGYPFDVENVDGVEIVRVRRTLAAIVDDVQAGAAPAVIGARFHAAMAEMTVAVCERIRAAGGPGVVTLSGGCFQNRLLFAQTVPPLRAAGFSVLVHHQVPCNDGGLSLGQAVIAQFASDL
ncbi:MAG: carbamoyltransferase HypF [Chloroflexi bacterium]|nr:carbamoyltransferase HypF [Chloroflexota bacterium]